MGIEIIDEPPEIMATEHGPKYTPLPVRPTASSVQKATMAVKCRVKPWPALEVLFSYAGAQASRLQRNRP